MTTAQKRQTIDSRVDQALIAFMMQNLETTEGTAKMFNDLGSHADTESGRIARLYSVLLEGCVENGKATIK